MDVIAASTCRPDFHTHRDGAYFQPEGRHIHHFGLVSAVQEDMEFKSTHEYLKQIRLPSVLRTAAKSSALGGRASEACNTEDSMLKPQQTLPTYYLGPQLDNASQDADSKLLGCSGLKEGLTHQGGPQVGHVEAVSAARPQISRQESESGPSTWPE